MTNSKEEPREAANDYMVLEKGSRSVISALWILELWSENGERRIG